LEATRIEGSRTRLESVPLVRALRGQHSPPPPLFRPVAGPATVGAGDEDQVVSRAARQAPRAEVGSPGAADRVALADLGDHVVLGPGPRGGSREPQEAVDLGQEFSPVGLALRGDHGEPRDRRRVPHDCRTGHDQIRYGGDADSQVAARGC